MINNKTVIISCAGMGTRLGAGKPKALIDIEGKPLLAYTLAQLKDVEDVRIVVGYQAEKVIELAKSIRKDITFVYNHKYKSNGTGASISLAKKYSKQYILTIDGDIIIHPEDMNTLLEADEPFVGVCVPSTDDPVLVSVNKNEEVTRFQRGRGKYEWTGVCLLESSKIIPTDKHTYYLVEQFLPLPIKIIRQREIDTPNDYKNAIAWVANNYAD